MRLRNRIIEVVSEGDLNLPTTKVLFADSTRFALGISEEDGFLLFEHRRVPLGHYFNVELVADNGDTIRRWIIWRYRSPSCTTGLNMDNKVKHDALCERLAYKSLCIPYMKLKDFQEKEEKCSFETMEASKIKTSILKVINQLMYDKAYRPWH